MGALRLRTLHRILKNTHADLVLLSYVAFVFVDALLIWVTEPTISTFRQALWYCYAVVSTAGFGDVIATSFLARILSVILTAYSALAIAIITGVVVNFYTNMIELRNKETISAVLDQLERLPEMSPEELKELSARISALRGSRSVRAKDAVRGGQKEGPEDDL